MRPAMSNASPIRMRARDRKSTRLNSSHSQISYAVFCLKKKTNHVYKRTHFNSHTLQTTQHMSESTVNYVYYNMLCASPQAHTNMSSDIIPKRLPCARHT